MNCAIPCAPAGDCANGLKFDSAMSWAASSAGRDVPALRRPRERLGVRRRARTTAACAPSRRRPRSPSRVNPTEVVPGVEREPVVPGFPGVALDEVKALRVRRQPPVGGGRAEVELGGEAVQRPARRRHPLRIRVAGEQHGLLGVRAKAADDDERDAVAARGGLHAIERGRDIRSHRLALAVRERPAVLAGAGRPERDVGRRRRARPRRARRRAPARARPTSTGIAHLDAHAHGGERVVVGKRHADVVRAVAASGGERRAAAALEVGCARSRWARLGRPPIWRGSNSPP